MKDNSCHAPQMLVDKMAKAVRRGRASAEKNAAEAAAERAAAGGTQGEASIGSDP